MTSYELMIQTNHDLIKSGSNEHPQGRAISKQFLSDRNASPAIQRQAPDKNGRKMYPMFYIPPVGEKLKTVLGQTPKTRILSANLYELEILRLLCLFAPERDEVKQMTAETLKRLKTTCFGFQDDGIGECFDASLIVLRFLAAAAPEETDWIKSRIDNYNRHRSEKKRPWFSEWYYWLCLSELPFPIALPELEKYKAEMCCWLTEKSCVMNSETDRRIHPVIFCILRHALSKYPEYAYIKNRQPYVKEEDGRLHFDMSR